MKKEIYIDTISLKQEANVFEECLRRLKEIFESEKTNTEKMNGTGTWEGTTQEALYNKKKSFQENFEPVEESIQTYINFMNKTIDDYEKFENTTNESIESGLENLDVNK